MSVVTNVILITAVSDLNLDHLAIPGLDGFYLVSVDTPSLPRGWYGGSKMLECTVYIGAFNHLDLDAFLLWVSRLPFEFPSRVQLLYKEEDDLIFTLKKFD